MTAPKARLWPKFLALTLAAAFLLPAMIPDDAGAQLGTSTLRKATRDVTRAVRNQVRQAIRPTLEVRRGATGELRALAMDPTGRFFATAPSDGTLRLFDANLGRQLQALRPSGAQIVEAALSGDAGEILVRDDTGRVLIAKPGEDFKPLGQVAASAVALSDQGLLLISRDRQLEVWSLPDQRIATLNLKAPALKLAASGTAADGFLAAALEGGEVFAGRISAAAGPMLGTFDIGAEVTALRLQADGRLALGTQEGGIQVWNVGAGNRMAAWQAHDAAIGALAVHGGGIVSGDLEGTVRLWDTAGARQGELAQPGAAVRGLALREKAGNQRLLVAAGGSLRIHDMAGGEEALRVIATESGWAALDRLGRFDGSSRTLDDVVWNADGDILPLDRFASENFEPGLLAKALDPAVPLLTPNAPAVAQGLFPPPEVAIDATGDSEAGAAVEIRVTAISREQGTAPSLRVFHNGKRVAPASLQARRSFEVDNRPALEEVYQVALLPGDNRFSASALGWGGIESDAAETSIAAAGTPPSRLHLITVGINAYANPEWSLNYAVADAVAVETLFQAKATGRYDQVITRKLLDESASQAAVKAQLDGLSTVGPNDVVIVFLSGHARTAGSEWFFMPSEMRNLADEAEVKRIGISSTALSEAFLASPAKQILLIVDACQAGAALEDFADFHQRRNLDGLARETGVHVLAAARADQLAIEFPILRNGIFTYTLVHAFDLDDENFARADDTPMDRQVTVTELKDFVERNVPLLAFELRKDAGLAEGARGDLLEQAPVTPVGLVLGSDFVLAGG
jgi:hypothetical protein